MLHVWSLTKIRGTYLKFLHNLSLDYLHNSKKKKLSFWKSKYEHFITRQHFIKHFTRLEVWIVHYLILVTCKKTWSDQFCYIPLTLFLNCLSATWINVQEQKTLHLSLIWIRFCQNHLSLFICFLGNMFFYMHKTIHS